MDTNKLNLKGLTQEQVQKRIDLGDVNVATTIKTKSIRRIFYDNICTLFNAINVILFVALILVGSYKNMLFMGVVLANTVIGIVHEIRSKISVDKLTILSEKKISVLRDSKILEISKDEIVLDDIIILSRGDQIPADCKVVSGECKVNESLLTGESDLILKDKDSVMLSGSFVASGKCYAKVFRVGAESYASKINNEAKYIKKVNSQILNSFNFIIKLCTFIIFPVGILFFIRQYIIQNGDIYGTVVSTVASLIGMIPMGMVLLTSSVLAVSIVRLARKKVLVQEMYCIESLARVDVLCLDKTGTLTADKMNVTDVIKFADESKIKKTLSSIVKASDEINATLYAIKDYVQDSSYLECKKFYPFSSETKWSGGSFEDGKTYIMGAAEFVFKDKEKYAEVFEIIEKISTTVRIIVLAESQSEIKNETLPDDLKPLAIILLKDELRKNVRSTVNYFKEQGVTLKVISGDSVKTVKNIAVDTGIEGAENAIDMSNVTTDDELYRAAEECNVFGRVTPAQKNKLVLALKSQGHTVAMTGDGVNDVLALKEADCSIAMASGSDAARNVSQLVLVNNDFSSMPKIVAEGRRTINNIERSSSLYMVKTIYSMVLTVFFIFFSMEYPFQPIQLTLVSALTVGLPSFVLALQPNKNRIRGNFTFNIIARALPAAICVILNIICGALASDILGINHTEFSTISVYMTALTCLMLVIRLSSPLNLLRGSMLVIIIAGLGLGCTVFRGLFSLSALGTNEIIIACCFGAATIIIFNILYNIAENLIERFKKKSIRDIKNNIKKDKQVQ